MQSIVVSLIIEPAHFAKLMGAMALLLNAGRLSCNIVFYYMAWTVVGVCASYLVPVWVFACLIASQAGMLTVLFTGWTVGLCMLQVFIANLNEIMKIQPTFIMWFVSVTALWSLFACYMWFRPDNPYNRIALQWLLQLCACLMIYKTSDYKLIGLILIAVAIGLYNSRVDVVAVVEGAPDKAKRR